MSPERLQEVSRGVADVFSGNLKVIVDDIESKMHKAADELRFEDAALLRDKLRMLQTVSEKVIQRSCSSVMQTTSRGAAQSRSPLSFCCV